MMLRVMLFWALAIMGPLNLYGAGPIQISPDVTYFVEPLKPDGRVDYIAALNNRITPDAAVYFVTFSVVEWFPVFVSGAACEIITNSLNFCLEQKGLCTNAFVIMPTHMHAIVFDRGFDTTRLLKSLTDFRKFTGRSLSDYCAEHMPRCFIETLRDKATADRERRFWQPSRHPEGIQTEPFWRQKMDYLHDNPRRKGLVFRPQDWRFSSAAYYISDGKEPCDVKIGPLDWT